MEIFNGKKEAQKLDEKILNILEKENNFGKLLIIQIGENPSSEKYVNLKKKVGEKLGIKIEVLKISEELDDEIITDKVKENINRDDVSSVIIQLPIPRGSIGDLVDLIPLEKDIDLLSHDAQQKFYDSSISRTSPVVRSAEYFIYSLENANQLKNATIVGGGFLVGRPVSKMLKNMGIDIRIIENYERGMTLDSDLIVLSAGIPNLVSGDDILGGTHVIDFGSSVVDGKTAGDLDMQTELSHLGTISPSPGGMGPLVIRFLFLNHLRK